MQRRAAGRVLHELDIAPKLAVIREAQFNAVMHQLRKWLIASLFGLFCVPAVTAAATFRAGAHAVDISPTGFPVRVNAMFTERSADKIVDPLFAKAVALDDGTTRLVLCVVDTCMMPRDLIDQAKAEASRAAGVPTGRMLVSATHTHSAPSAMGCLGSRADPRYADFLPGRITSAIVGAVERLAPARVGWAQVDDWKHTFSRRWIRRPDRLLADPFGERNVRAHMHPGHESPDAIGPSGPVDPQLSVLAFQRLDGRPIALLANYSQHYYGSPLLSSDYYGRFARHMATLLGAEESFVGIMSQGTSGDLMWMDYGAPRHEIGYDAYAREIAEQVAGMVKTLRWRDIVPLKMAERTLELGYRIPGEERLSWSRNMAAKLGGRLPQSQSEIYALESLYLHERPRTELKLQALRIGDLGIAALPNEVFAITGLKLKRQSPLAATFNIELANGAEGYIPPPEQHKLGGYTTWPARTAGLETNAEPRIVETLLSLLENVSRESRRPNRDLHGPYARAVIDARPQAYWRLEEMIVPAARDAVGLHDAVYEDGVAVYLPGADGRVGFQPPQPPATNAFSGSRINRSAHFAGGRLRANLPLGDQYSISLWIWNGLPPDARAVAGYFASRGPDRDQAARGEHLGIGGTYRADLTGKLILFNGNERNEVLVGRTSLALRAWHHIVFVRDGANVRVHLDGRAEPEITGRFAHTVPAKDRNLFFGGRNDGLFDFEGKLDEIAVYPRPLPASEITSQYAAASLKSPAPVVKVPPPPISSPISAKESLQKIHVPAGYRVDLVASEPLTIDPVALDWDPAGRLWVVEMADYPLGMDGKGKPGGRVRVLEDSNADGRYDKQTLFADGLSFPTGLLTWRDGVIVTAAPEVLLLRDTNGDGRADSREVLVSGLTTGNQQLRANGLRWGLDGWVYCAAGGHHGEYGAGTRLRTRFGEVVVGSRDFRFRPDTGELEPQSGPSQFGRNRDDWGHWFGTQNSRPLWHYVLADHYLRRNPHVAAPDPIRQVVVPLNPKVWPASPPEKRFHSFENSGHFTSACSGMIYRDELLFARSEHEMHAFTCEPFHNLVQHNVVTPDGVTFKAHRAAGEETNDFFASEDRWCRPVMTRTGPDGALWVVDMYRYMIEHPDWLPPEGRAELLPHYRLGDDRGRIYRVLPADQPPRKTVTLDKLSTSDLVAALDSPNEWQRDKAQMLLAWRADQGAVGPLVKLAATSANPLARLHALCALDNLGVMPVETLMQALNDEHPGIRANALRLAETRGTPAVVAIAVRLVDDSDPKVRLQLACTLGAWSNAVAGEALGRLVVANHADPFLIAAAMSSALPHVNAMVEAAVKSGPQPPQTIAEPLIDLALAVNDRLALATLLAPILTPRSGDFSAAQFDATARFLKALGKRKLPLATLANSDDSLAVLLRDRTGDRQDSILDAALRIGGSERQPTDQRAAAIRLIARDESRRPEALKLLARQLLPQVEGALQRAAISALAATAEASVPATLLASFPTFPPASRIAALDVLLSREAWAYALTQHAQSNDSVTLDAAQRARLLKHSSKRIRELAANVFVPTARTRVVEQFQPALKLSGDATRGRAIFHRVCAVCHKVGDTGAEVGPDLKSVASHSPEKLLANILDPSADIQPGYTAYHCELADGAELYGLIASETGTSITFKGADGVPRTVLRKDITSLKSANVSLMPDGLDVGMSAQDMADLIQFLRSGMPAAGR